MDDSIDLFISQAVMEHVMDLDTAYTLMYKWLKSGGKMSHQIDFRCHGTSTKWNGHWLYGEKEWKFVNDIEGVAINRSTFKSQIDIMESKGFRIETTILQKEKHGFDYNYLIKKFPKTSISKEEFSTSGMFVIATKTRSFSTLEK